MIKSDISFQPIAPEEVDTIIGQRSTGVMVDYKEYTDIDGILRSTLRTYASVDGSYYLQIATKWGEGFSWREVPV